MSANPLYPASPANVPADLTKAKSSYKRQAWLAMFGLMGFMLIYISLMLCFAYIAYRGFVRFGEYNQGIFALIIPICALILAVFMGKSFFAVRKSGETGGIEVTESDEPELYKFLHTLADEIGAPRPHRVFVTPEVNAAVFYDLSLLNLLFPSKKNLIVGLGLVNVLNLGEFKAVLAHEFGHFAQGSMVVGRWVYTAQQIISYMVSVRDWLDSLVKGISRIDIRIAWIGWILQIIIWSLRAIMDTLFRIVIIAERALSREMEFNADLVAVSVTGSDALVNALYKLQTADHAWQTAFEVARTEAGDGKLIENLFQAQEAAIEEMRRVLNNSDYGVPPQSEYKNDAKHRVFKNESARPPQMWSTHPPSSDREENAKALYIPAEIDQRSAWQVFSDPEDIKKKISLSFYNQEKIPELELIEPTEAVSKKYSNTAFSPEYRGAYLQRSPVRSFDSVHQILHMATTSDDPKVAISNLYPESISDELKDLRELEIERDTLEALLRGDLKPSGGVIRHRGEELEKSEIPEAIESLAHEIGDANEKLMQHDADCRKAHLLAAEKIGNGWHAYLLNIVELLHASEHMAAVVDNEHALLINTWNVITADGQIGHFEKKRILRVCENLHQVMNDVSQSKLAIKLPETLRKKIGIESWSEACPRFDFNDVTKKNWPDWVQAASETMGQMSYALNVLRHNALETMIQTENLLAKYAKGEMTVVTAPEAGSCPQSYPTLMPGDEYVLQKKLDLWNRFQLAHGAGPTIMRLLVSAGIVGGTIYGGLVGF